MTLLGCDTIFRPGLWRAARPNYGVGVALTFRVGAVGMYRLEFAATECGGWLRLEAVVDHLDAPRSRHVSPPQEPAPHADRAPTPDGTATWALTHGESAPGGPEVGHAREFAGGGVELEASPAVLEESQARGRPEILNENQRVPFTASGRASRSASAGVQVGRDGVSRYFDERAGLSAAGFSSGEWPSPDASSPAMCSTSSSVGRRARPRRPDAAPRSRGLVTGRPLPVRKTGRPRKRSAAPAIPAAAPSRSANAVRASRIAASPPNWKPSWVRYAAQPFRRARRRCRRPA